MRRILIGLIATMLSVSAFSAVQTTNKGTITKLFAYDDYGAVAGRDGADITVWMETGISNCSDGVWVSPVASGYKMIGSFLLTAYTTKQQVSFQVYTDKVWKGSSKSKLCQVDAIRFE
ncbi:conserved exported hypothetical protein [Vibrio coralliirubri]|uniref:hypothetical protein n=1 Tax=Vibrio coralliirubri TaxID=1516159 RepID=UPI0006308057|nr:hypothetical protein [Vibrio coralliirubri]CDU08701.1 conserved exported hypothetical protein [Vibrio coralliirubri]